MPGYNIDDPETWETTVAERAKYFGFWNIKKVLFPSDNDHQSVTLFKGSDMPTKAEVLLGGAKLGFKNVAKFGSVTAKLVKALVALGKLLLIIWLVKEVKLGFDRGELWGLDLRKIKNDLKRYVV